MKAVVLAGGSGSRLWPMSRQQLPKQFLKLGGDESLLAATISRLSPKVEIDDVWVVTNEAHASGEAFSELEHLHTILEPCGRNTAPAIALAAALLMRDGDDPCMLVLPADHLIADIPAFHQGLEQAVKAAEDGSLVTFGIVPEHPDTGFGYIQADMTQQAEAYGVQRFTEKPDLATARSFLEQGGYFWNSGMFVWKASVILDEIQRLCPEIAAVLASMQKAWEAEDWQEVVRYQFQDMPSISIDYAVLEASERVKVVPVLMGWSDVGSWDAVFDISAKDDGNNAVSGRVMAIDCTNSLLRSESRLIAAVGLDDVIAVETPDAILLCPRGQSQRVREVVDRLKLEGDGAYREHLTVKRPWGSYTVLENLATGFKLKRIEVREGASLSLQSHQHRSEHWIVVSGTATVTRDDEILTVTKNESTYIPIGVKHRLQNKGKMPLQMIEVQVGDYLEEDDIERFDDVYGRS